VLPVSALFEPLSKATTDRRSIDGRLLIAVVTFTVANAAYRC